MVQYVAFQQLPNISIHDSRLIEEDKETLNKFNKLGVLKVETF